MNCPKCGAETKVVNSRKWYNDEQYRRRECTRCGIRFTTSEKVLGGFAQGADVTKVSKRRHKQYVTYAIESTMYI